MIRKHNEKLTNPARALRKNMTRQEKRLWYDYLNTYPVRFYRQKVLGKYIADFYCANANLVIELDGSQHYTMSGAESDADRTAFLNGYGIDVLRISNYDVDTNFEGVCIYIDGIVRSRLEKQERAPASPDGVEEAAESACLP